MIKVMIPSVETQKYQQSSGSDVTSCSIGNPSITLAFRLCTSTNTSSVLKEYYNFGSLAIPGGSDTFHLTNPGLRSTRVNRHNPRQVCNLDSLSTSQK
jgi:hypothetical protein